MKFCWNKKPKTPKTPDPAAVAALNNANRRLKEANDRQPEVDSLSKWARERREMNHLSVLFFGDLDKNHRGTSR